MMNKHRQWWKGFLTVAVMVTRCCGRAAFSLISEGFDDISHGHEDLPEATDRKEICFSAIYNSNNLKEELEHKNEESKLRRYEL